MAQKRSLEDSGTVSSSFEVPDFTGEVHKSFLGATATRRLVLSTNTKGALRNENNEYFRGDALGNTEHFM